MNGSKGKLAARISLPSMQKNDTCPVVIFSHSFGGDMTLPIYETAAKFNGSAMVINSMADVVVPYTYAERYHNVLKKVPCILSPEKITHITFLQNM